VSPIPLSPAGGEGRVRGAPAPKHFADRAVVHAMRYDHLELWLGLSRVVRRWLRPGCRVLDLGSSAGDCLRLLCEVRPLRLSVGTYRRWRATRRSERSEWFASDADERRYFTEVGKLVFLGAKSGAD